MVKHVLAPKSIFILHQNQPYYQGHLLSGSDLNIKHSIPGTETRLDIRLAGGEQVLY